MFKENVDRLISDPGYPYTIGNVTLEEGTSADMWYYIESIGRQGWNTKLIIAIKQYDLDSLLKIIAEGTDINSAVDHSGNTAAHFAMGIDQPFVIPRAMPLIFWMCQNADLSLKNEYGNTVLDIARYTKVWPGDKTIYEVLLENNLISKPEIQLNHKKPKPSFQ
jgi:hypothetical protein